MVNDIEHLLAVQNEAGESPHWHPDKKALYWADIINPHIYIYFPETGLLQDFALDIPVTGLGLRKNGGLILAAKNGLHLAGPNLSEVDFLIDPEKDKANVRFNDGLVDPAGRFWAGTLNEVDPSADDGSLYRYTSNGGLDQIDQKLKGPNGIGWSPDQKTMYLTDCFAQRIYVYDYDVVTGKIENRRILVQVPGEDGMPDGLTVDSEGFIWSAHWGGWRVTRYDPEGKIERILKLPVQNVTSCIFGGEDLSELFITTAWYLLSDSDRREQPLAGDLFKARPGVKGLPDPFFDG